MDRMLYVAMSGAKQNMYAQAIKTNNLANVDTTGFRKDFAVMQSAYINGDGYDSRVYSVTNDAGIDFSPGKIITTDNKLDVTVDGEGWIAVRGMDDREAFIKSASLIVNAQGLLVSNDGHFVIGNDNGPVAVPPADTIEIGNDGTISIVPAGQDPNTLIAIDRLKLVRPENADMKKAEDGLMYVEGEDAILPDAGVKVRSGAIEGSNVNPVEEMIQMISLSRQFETDIKMMKLSEELDSSSSELMKT